MVEEPFNCQAVGMLPCWGIVTGHHSSGAVVAGPLRGLRRRSIKARLCCIIEGLERLEGFSSWANLPVLTCSPWR